jgi:hypothetical protein
MPRNPYSSDASSTSGEIYKCWKVRQDLATVQTLVTKAEASGGFLRWYLCGSCGFYHTTSRRDRAPKRPYCRQPQGGRRHWSRGR